ncbi:hypothetical protein [Polaromonas sp.]
MTYSQVGTLRRAKRNPTLPNICPSSADTAINIRGASPSGYAFG